MNIALLESKNFTYGEVKDFIDGYQDMSCESFGEGTLFEEVDSVTYDLCLITLSEHEDWQDKITYDFLHVTPIFICETEFFKHKIRKRHKAVAHQVFSCEDFDTGLLSAFFQIFLVKFKLEKAAHKFESRSFGHHEENLMSLGQATAGITHEVNNIMQSVGLSIDLALRKYGKSKDIKPLLESLNHLATRGRKVTRQILDLAREESSTLDVINIKDFINNLSPLLKMNVTGGNSFDVSNLDWPHFAYIDESKMTFSLVNLIKNANDACNNAAIKLNVSVDGTHCFFDVIDSGKGISDEDIEHIFEPFFTTKRTGKGTGLGLPYVKKMIQEHGGDIQVTSSSGRGTCFRLQIPLTNDASDSQGSSEKVRGKKRFLIVDDQEDLTDVLKMIIEDEGHLVADFYCPLSALDYFESFHDSIDVVICDFNMPSMNGHDVICKMKTMKDQGVKYIISSGDPFLQVELPDDVKILAKPFNVEELYQLVFEDD